MCCTGLMFSRTLFLIITALVTSSCAQGGQNALADSRIKLVPCEAPNYPGEAQCGTYLVWENRQARSGRQIAINVVVLPATGDRQPDPVFYFDGGPGAAATGAIGYMARVLRDVNQHRDLVFMDIRGTGRSNPLTCPRPAEDAPLQEHFEEFLSDAYVRRCLENQTADVRFYTQPFAMDDVNEVRAALGYERINLYGASGGTRQEQIYMKRHGATVRSVVMHGVHAMDGEMPLPFSRALEDGMRGLIEACDRDEACRSRDTDLRGDWEAVKKQFERGPVEASVAHPRTGEVQRVTITKGVYADGLRHLLYNLNGAATVPAELHRAARGDFDAFARRELEQSGRFARVLSHGLFITATCAEDVAFIDEDDVRRATSGTFLGDYRVRRQQAACRIWPKGEGIDADFQKPAALDVPVLIISGEFDTATPPSEAERVAKHLPNARHVVFPNQAHDLTNPDCASALVAAFVQSADHRSLDTGCVARTRRPAFR
jgi:pimeloyl-ACP methyl ester carboxylesterase